MRNAASSIPGASGSLLHPRSPVPSATPTAVDCSTAVVMSAMPGCGDSDASSSPVSRSTPSIRRSSVSDSRPTASMLANTSAALSGFDVHDLAPGGGLHRHDAHRVRNHVVHLAGDPAAFSDDRTFGLGEAIGLGCRSAAFGVDEDPLAVADRCTPAAIAPTRNAAMLSACRNAKPSGRLSTLTLATTSRTTHAVAIAHHARRRCSA